MTTHRFVIDVNTAKASAGAILHGIRELLIHNIPLPGGEELEEYDIDVRYVTSASQAPKDGTSLATEFRYEGGAVDAYPSGDYEYRLWERFSAGYPPQTIVIRKAEPDGIPDLKLRALESLLTAWARGEESQDVDWEDLSAAVGFAREAMPGRYEEILVELGIEKE